MDCGTGLNSSEQGEVSTETIVKGSIPGNAASYLVDYGVCVILCRPSGSNLFIEIWTLCRTYTSTGHVQ